MLEKPPNHSNRRFLLRVLFPAALAICLFVLSLFAVIIPAFEAASLTRKREMIRELTASAWSVLSELHQEQQAGLLSESEAQQRAVARIRDMRYGNDRKDYFWITDMLPRMIMHPYRPELEGQDLSDFKDRGGKALFVEFVKTVRTHSDGYVDYQWQWKDDATRVVPKLSYVRKFEPWNWIIGTGIYIEDVKQETAQMTDRLINISLIITVIISLLLLLNIQQSLHTERQRQQAEKELRESKDKYQTLVEAATEGIIMLLDGRQTYVNQTLLDMLGYTNTEFKGMSIEQIVWPGDQPHQDQIKNLIDGQPTIGQIEARLKRKDDTPVDVILVTSEISLAGKTGHVIAARDITRHKKIEEKLGESEKQYRALTDAINIGVFRSTVGRKGRFLEANPAAMRILGFTEQDELLSSNILDLFHDADDRDSFLTQLRAQGSVKNRILRLKKKDGTVPILSVSAVLIPAGEGSEEMCDGVMEDITDREQAEQEREGLIVEMQTALLFLNQPVRNSVQEALSCDMSTPISKAALLMARNNASAILVRTRDNEFVGILTDSDLRDRVVASDCHTDHPVFEVMSSPLIWISDRALLFEAALLMQEKGIAHLVVRDGDEAVVGLLGSRDLLQVDRYSSSFLLREIHEANAVDEIVRAHDRLPLLVRALMSSGANSRNIARIVASVSDSVTSQLIRIAVDELGPPPCKFAFLALGSEGREEQTLKTDQDNAIVFDDSLGSITDEDREYFLKLGDKVCGHLAKAGYAFCAGDAMAKNPRWCQPLSQWKEYFTQWIRNSDPNDLIAISIFFDFRCVYGAKALADDLQEHVVHTANGRAAFFQHLTINALQYKPPISFFGNIQVGASEGQPEAFDIKKAMMPIVDLARIYTLFKGTGRTNTLDRLQRIRDAEVLNKTEYEDIVRAYDYLMTLRFKHQTRQLGENKQPDNFINPKDLAQIELASLKKTLTQIAEFQAKLRSEFTGTA